MRPEIKETADAVIVGAGAAGLVAALALAPRQVVVLSEQEEDGICASLWSQGGIAASVGPGDSARSHAEDTLRAAAGTADADAVRELTRAAPECVALLEQYGVNFARNPDGGYALSREACHARRRVLKAAAGDGFGRELMRALWEAVRKTPSITFIGGVSAERVLRRSGSSAGPVEGVLARDVATGRAVVFAAPAVLIATGGIGGLYAATTNPLGAVGRGLAMAARAGAVLADLEFVQFHPTALDLGLDPAPLATEALRGEGALLVDDWGQAFIDPLAPRDVVSRAVFDVRGRGGRAFLDCRMIDTSRFPALVSACARAGLDPRHDRVPVMPAVHYHMGGIATDLEGRSSVAGLWAAGEAASTGLHGANRLASNSILEAVAMGARAARSMGDFLARSGARANPVIPVIADSPSRGTSGKGADMLRADIRRVMSDLVGVARDGTGLRDAITELSLIGLSDDAKTADMALVARMIAVSALMRAESRGGHWRSDHPAPRGHWEKRSFTTLRDIESITDKTLQPAREKENAA